MDEPSTPSRPSADLAIEVFRRWFLNRTDVVAIRAPWDKPCPVEGGDGLDALLRAHIDGEAAPAAVVQYAHRRGIGATKGRFRIGSYAPGPDNLTRWTCLDFDGTGHAEALADPLAAARAACAAFERAGLPCFLERSGGGHGWHVWAFFETPIAAAKAQALGRAMAPTDAPLADGSGVADVLAARGIECFPKQAKLGKKGYGNLVWLPWWREAVPGANLFYRVAADGTLAPYVPTFAGIREEDVDRVLAAVVATSAPVSRPAGIVAEGSVLGPAAADGGDPAWADWRKRALAALDLPAVYGTWLTGKESGAGWLECRDPASASGDQHPSAGVADGTGQAERGAFHSHISGKTLSVFDFLVAHGGASDFRAACARIAELSGVAFPEPRAAAPAAPGPSRPRVRINGRQLRDVLADAWRAVHATNTRPSLFARGGVLVRLARAEDGPRIEHVEETAMYGHLVRVANWVRVTPDGVLDATPPKDVARDMLVNPDEALPPLDAVVATPVFDAGGRLVAAAGYSRDARLWHHRAPDFEVDPVPERPGEEDVRAARSLLLDELLVDFPFAAASDRAHALAALVLPFVRRMVTGCTPLHLIEAPTPGSGKGLLADVLAIVALGRPCDPTTITPDEDEARKKITSILARAQPLILLDNVKDGLDSAQLASALTAETWSDRLLGQTRMIDLPNRATWLVTANNPHLSLEIARRCVRVRIDPKQDRPWRRSVFKHPQLRDWARRNRPALVRAVLVLVQSWIAAGRPAGAQPLGSFESWAEVVGGILRHAGIEGFLKDTEKLYEEADSEGQEWREFVTAWWAIHGDTWVATADLLRLAGERDLLGGVVGDKSERSRLIRLGRALSAARDRHFGAYRVAAGRNSNSKAAQYRLLAEETECAAAAPAGPASDATSGFGDGLDDLLISMEGAS
ncbi:MAG: hypothetical protein HMLKMBBP_01648 [Planctomycetes bacterium]|nr:hypothetical protein [Planctomycetota bacterium]